MSFLFGRKGRMKQRSTLNPAQQGLAQQYYNSIGGQGAGGAFGDVADYYRGNLSDNPADFQAFAAPEMRRFNEQIIPGLSEQFAGMGSGGLSSSGFRNAAVGAGTDLSERLGAIRANLRQQSAQGLQGFAQGGLNPSFNENYQERDEPGLLGYAAQGLGASGAIPGAFQSGFNWLQNRFGNKRQDTSGLYQGPNKSLDPRDAQQGQR